ncbi:MAG: glycosyltransferase family 4 protein [Acidobacteriota bacterium]
MSSHHFLFLTQTYPRYDGDTSGPFIRDLARALVRGGDRVSVLTPHAEDVPASWDDDGVAVRSFRYAPTPLELVGYSRSLDRDETLKGGAIISAPLYAVGMLRAVRKFLAHNQVDLVHAHWVVPNGVIAAAVARHAPLAVGLHGSDVFLAERAGVRRAVAAALRRTSVLTGCSPELVERVCALGFDTAYAHVIPYGVDVEQFHPDPARRAEWRKKLGIPDDAPLAVSVGRMATKKGYQVLLDALPQLMVRSPELHIVLAGAGDRLNEFRQRAAPWGNRVHFPGRVLRDTLPDLYRAADIFVLPAVHDPKGNVDGLPNVILEGMASGLPVVASRISGIPLAVEEGTTGRLIEEGDVAGLTDALDELAGNPERAREMGQAGRRRAEAELTWDAVGRRYRAAYDQALTGH